MKDKRKEHLGPIITLQDMIETYPYKNVFYEVLIKGEQLKRMLEYSYRDEANELNHTEFYQLSEGLNIEYSRSLKKITKFTYYDEDIDMSKLYKVCIIGFDFINIKEFFNISEDEILANGPKKVVCTSTSDALYEYLDSKEKLPNYPVKDRLKFID